MLQYYILPLFGSKIFIKQQVYYINISSLLFLRYLQNYPKKS